jgi:hypothetical protein
MEKFTTILSIAFLSMGLFCGAARAGCLQDASVLAARAQGDPDWVRRETVLAILAEARRDAQRGREAACASTVQRARTQSRSVPH